jgi:hypothetical protein
VAFATADVEVGMAGQGSKRVKSGMTPVIEGEIMPAKLEELDEPTGRDGEDELDDDAVEMNEDEDEDEDADEEDEDDDEDDEDDDEDDEDADADEDEDADDADADDEDEDEDDEDEDEDEEASGDER